jgi:rubrerythrin
MPIPFEQSATKENLMKAFAGESQARNRYTMAAEEARKQNLHVLEQVFTFTADQEKEHGEIFYEHLSKMAGKTIRIEADYPVDPSGNMEEMLRFSQKHEYEEHDSIYKEFAKTAKEEGYPQIAASFELIAGIEKYHGDRFGKFAKYMEEGKLHFCEVEVGWMCLNCGYIASGSCAPKNCPVCHESQGYFIRLSLAPFENKEI